ncbi:MAG: gamma-glutamyltransferase [Deltaproteobacteria bacterium]|nr:gamma-glutamyltransferase [Deltaproteobacteria bacterium]
MSARHAIVALGLVLLSLGHGSARAAWGDPARATEAMVASAHPLATEAGRAILAAGGSAVDAAIAVSFALSVVEPWSSGLGGGGFMVVSQGGVVTTFDMREMAPAAATRDMYVVDGAMDARASTRGMRSAGVPGLVRGLVAAWRRFGKLPLPLVMRPAITLARDGFPASPRLAASIAAAEADLNPAARAVFLPGGEAPAVGRTIVQADLAAALARIAASEGEDFYVGETARLLVAGVRAEGGLWTDADLAGYKVVERAPVRGTYAGYDIVSMGPPSSGGVLLVQMLGVLERLSRDGPRPSWLGAEWQHRLAEVMKRAFALRASGLADPDFFPVDMQRFTGAATIDRIAAEVRAAKSATPASAIGTVEVKERLDTTHFSIVLGNGDGVAMTQTINLGFGAAAVAPGTGVVLNDEMDDFAGMPGVPNAFGLLGDEANAIAPGKRPLSSMTPTLVLKDGRVVGSFGSPGGSRIISTTLQVLLRVVDDGLDPAEALGAPRIHHQWYPDRLEVEPMGVAPETRARLEALGHKVHQAAYMGNAMALWRRADGVLEGAADPRGEGHAAGL